ncbi:hypothetical protein LMG33818_001998 [Halomonadaceae bacterium LMG 33818]|uniref:glucosamine inositolphosphorylceramide transferase family protein n=1 Tax=Cernens ardua TaxID=3402176 RepID=UPI003EDCB145
MSLLETEIWRIGIIPAPIDKVAEQAYLESARITWLEAETSFCFLADPFGIWRDNTLYVFAELYDYRTRKGVIVVYLLDRHLNKLEHRVVLEEPWHLSYPYIVEAEGEIWMLPEGYKSGALTLYRAKEFPWQWERMEDVEFPCAGIDASLLHAEESWWLFYTLPSPKEARTSTLMLARSTSIFGPWKNISESPIHHDRGGARMGGTPFIHDNQVILPTQDCTRTYGGALRLLSFPLDNLHMISCGEAATHHKMPIVTQGPLLKSPQQSAPYVDGFHTLSAVESVDQRDEKSPRGEKIHLPPITLIDTKQEIRGSLHRIGIDFIRALKKQRKT